MITSNTDILENWSGGGEVLQMNLPEVKYIRVEVKTPGFSLFSQVIPLRGDLSIRSLVDRFHNLHKEVESTIKKCGMYYPTIEWKYIVEGTDIIVYFGSTYPSNEYVRIVCVPRPESD